MKGRRTAGLPWHYWAAYLLVGLIVYAGYWLWPPRFQLSPVAFATQAEGCTVDFDAINHGRTPIARSLRVTVFQARPGNKVTPPLNVPLDYQDISIVLAPSGKKMHPLRFSPARSSRAQSGRGRDRGGRSVNPGSPRTDSLIRAGVRGATS